MPPAKLQPVATQVSEDLETLLSESLSSVREREQSTLDGILAGHRGRCVLFGAGSLGRASLRCLSRDGIQPLAFADNNSQIWNTTVEGIPVLSPADAVASYGSDAAFFVTIWTTGHRYAETYARLTSLGAQSVHPAAALRWKYSANLLPFYLQDLPHKVYEEADAVRAAFSLWSDDLSRQEYLRQIRYRALGDYQGLAAPDPEPSYFLDSIFALRPDEVFVDCGAYDGDTIRELLERRGTAFSKILALEPDPQSFVELQRYLATLPHKISARIEAYPYAASDCHCQLRFSALGSLISSIATTGGSGDIVVNALSLDDLLRGRAPSFIKMDIEGAEVEALNGARSLIARHQPLLSVCLYHRQNDLWRIPLQIHSMHPGYRYYLRSHEEDGWQTVGYAVPPERVKTIEAAGSKPPRVRRAKTLRAASGPNR